MNELETSAAPLCTTSVELCLRGTLHAALRTQIASTCCARVVLYLSLGISFVDFLTDNDNNNNNNNNRNNNNRGTCRHTADLSRTAT
jgi:hypothetical protein